MSILLLRNKTALWQRRESSEASHLIAPGMWHIYCPAGNRIRLLFPHFSITNKKRGISIFIRSTAALVDVGRVMENILNGGAVQTDWWMLERATDGGRQSVAFKTRQNTADVFYNLQNQ